MPSLCICRPTGYRLECPDIGTYLFQLGACLRQYPDIEHVWSYNVCNPRIMMMRNMCVEYALEQGATHILFIDPDMVPDRYVRLGEDGKPIGKFKPFFDEAWRAAKEYPCSVWGAPYVGQPPDSPIHVFCRNEKSELVRVDKETALQQEGWMQVDAIGTGLLLIDTEVFRRIPKPWFRDEYVNEGCSKLTHSQDIWFCLQCAKENIPIYVNWDCPAGHWQNVVCEYPGAKEEKKSADANPSPCSPPKLAISGSGDPSWK